MKKVALSLCALTLTAGSALAADLPTRKGPEVLPPPPPPPMWTGFYVGLNAGGSWTNSNGQYIGVGPVAADAGWPGAAAPTSQSPLVAALSSVASTVPSQGNHLAAFASAASAAGANGGNNGGFIGGGQIGYNWQFYKSFVTGIEADIQGLASNSGSRSGVVVVPTNDRIGSNFIGVTSARGNLQYLGTVRGRLGWLFTPTLLAYGTGGLAYGGVTLNTGTSVSSDQLAALAPSFGGVNFSNTQVGWTAGGGLEWMFLPNWSAKAEYLYYDLGTVTQNFSLASVNSATNAVAVFGGQARARINGNIVRAGVNYHFNWGSAPVVAKY